MNKWIAVDKDHVDGGLTGTVTGLRGVGNWTTSVSYTHLTLPTNREV